MADKKLSELTELTVPALNDEIYIRDVSEGAESESKRVTISNLKSGVVVSDATKVFSSPEDMAHSPSIDTPTKAWT